MSCCQTPAEMAADLLRPDFGLENHGLHNLNQVYWNLSTPALQDEAVIRGECESVAHGPVVIYTGEHCARAPKDKFVVSEETSEKNIWWGQYNVPIEESCFYTLLNRMRAYLHGKDAFVQDTYGGSDPRYRLPVRVITEHAWQSMFVRNALIPVSREEAKDYKPGFTVIALPDFRAVPEIDGVRSGTAILLNFKERMALIAGSGYAGEIKKSVFTVFNYLLPLQNVLSMHCSANVGKNGSSALFFGLSGTGKTTLSADPRRRLIGDDEHGWSDDGIFNFENGCYAKVINLNPEAEPEIFACTKRSGTVLENVVYDPVTRELDLDDDSHTPNTRASYPLEFIDNAVPEKKAGHPKHVIMLTCDAFGVMPPIARLSPEQALYHFISGYTAKVAGTEVGLSKEPVATFSTCFGAPFMVHHPARYAEMLRERIREHNASCWLVNTGWVGGSFGIGKRISIKHTRALLDAVLEGKLDQGEFRSDPLFGYEVPVQCPGVPDEVLRPEDAWSDSDAYWKAYKDLARRFQDNFKQFAEGTDASVIAAGPKTEL